AIGPDDSLGPLHLQPDSSTADKLEHLGEHDAHHVDRLCGRSCLFDGDDVHATAGQITPSQSTEISGDGAGCRATGSRDASALAVAESGNRLALSAASACRSKAARSRSD